MAKVDRSELIEKFRDGTMKPKNKIERVACEAISLGRTVEQLFLDGKVGSDYILALHESRGHVDRFRALLWSMIEEKGLSDDVGICIEEESGIVDPADLLVQVGRISGILYRDRLLNGKHDEFDEMAKEIVSLRIRGKPWKHLIANICTSAAIEKSLHSWLYG